jgi:hypothetical protein
LPLDANVLAAEVALAIKSAVGPVVERLAAVEARLGALGDVRDRVVTLEAKSAHVAPVAEPVPAVDLSPVLERVAAAEARIDTVGDLRDRVVTLESKSVVPVAVLDAAPPVDLSPVLERLAAAEARLNVVGDLRDRVVVVETKAAQPVSAPEPVNLAPVLDRVAALELKAAETAPIIASVAASTKDTAAMLERRIAAVEDRALLPGPPGEKGQDGKDGRDGINGKDGADGLGFDDLIVTQDDERTLTIKAARGERVKEIGKATFPVEIYRGVFVESRQYERGDCATYGGSEWHCNEPTDSKPGDGSKAWTLKVKKGRDGKDGRDAAGPLPVVSIKR